MEKDIGYVINIMKRHLKSGLKDLNKVEERRHYK